jgi:hypothetical protein
MCWSSSHFENQNMHELQTVQKNLREPAQLVSAEK